MQEVQNAQATLPGWQAGARCLPGLSRERLRSQYCQGGEEGEDLYVYEGPYRVMDTLLTFPNDLVDHDEDKKMLLTWYACSDAVGSCTNWSKICFRVFSFDHALEEHTDICTVGMAEEIVCVCVKPRVILRIVVFHLGTGEKHVISDVNNPVVFRVKLKYGAGIFCLDLSPSQFGDFDELVMLWEKYHAAKFTTMNPLESGDVTEKGYGEPGRGKPLVTDGKWRVFRSHLAAEKKFCAEKKFYAANDAFKLGTEEAFSTTVPLLEMPDEMFVQAHEVLFLALDRAVSDIVGSMTRRGRTMSSLGLPGKDKELDKGEGRKKNPKEEEEQADIIPGFGAMGLNGQHMNVNAPITVAMMDEMMRSGFIVLL